MRAAAYGPTRYHKDQFPVPLHTSVQVPHASTSFAAAYMGMYFTTVQHNIAEACGCKQPQAFGRMHWHIFPYFDWACVTLPRTTWHNKEGGNYVECMQLNVCHCLHQHASA